VVGSDFAVPHGVIEAFSASDADWEDWGSFKTVLRRNTDTLASE
jgi:hypothetical protein